MIILVINCGSSSLKYQLFNMKEEMVLAKGLAERIGQAGSGIIHNCPGQEKIRIEISLENHQQAISEVLKVLTDREHGPLAHISDIDAVGHRVVHGGETFADSVKIDETVMETIRKNIDLAPLHNPPNIMGIEACQAALPSVPQVAVFDTAFHQTMPEYAFIYGLPYEYYKNYGIRRYGFHGTSHRYVTQRVSQLTGQPLDRLKIISCHLGNGASITAIENGKSMETSMGFTPLEGLIMGTRCGDIDPAIVFYMMKELNMSPAEVNKVLNKKSGVYGISGVSSDFRDLEAAASQGNKRANLALQTFYYQVIKYIGAYAAVMDGVDIVVFTAGLGENSPKTREEVCGKLSYLGIEIDRERNQVRSQEAMISTNLSTVKVFVIPTNEEMMIAKDTAELAFLNS